MVTLGYRVHSNQKALFCEHIATFPIAERQCSSTYQYIIHEMSVILCLELLIYQYFSIKV